MVISMLPTLNVALQNVRLGESEHVRGFIIGGDNRLYVTTEGPGAKPFKTFEVGTRLCERFEVAEYELSSEAMIDMVARPLSRLEPTGLRGVLKEPEIADGEVAEANASAEIQTALEILGRLHTKTPRDIERLCAIAEELTLDGGDLPTTLESLRRWAEVRH